MSNRIHNFRITAKLHTAVKKEEKPVVKVVEAKKENKYSKVAKSVEEVKEEVKLED